MMRIERNAKNVICLLIKLIDETKAYTTKRIDVTAFADAMNKIDKQFIRK